MERRDVVIVGGGPAGSTLAWALRGSGLAVSVLDRRHFPRDKTCAGWITPAVVRELALDVQDYRRDGRVLQPINGFRVGVIGAGELASDHGAEPVSFGIRRSEFDAYLLGRCGAELYTGTPLAKLCRDGAHWIVNDTLRTPLLVGAGGHYCPVARMLGEGRGETVVAAQEIEFELSPAQQARCPVRGTEPRLYFCADLKGYGWVFRKGEWLNVGLGREDPHRLGAHVEAFRARLVRDGVLPADTPVRFKGHAYLLYDHAPRPLIGDGIVLVGDAAGLAYTRSGEGIRPAVESALLAARVIRAARDDVRPARLAAYVSAMEARFGRRAARDVVPSPPSRLRQALGRYLLGTRWFTRRVVTERWFLHRQQAALNL